MSYVAFHDGLSHEIFPLIGTAGTAVVCLHYYHALALFVHNHLVMMPIALLDFVIFLLLVIIVGIIFKLLRIVVDNLIKVTWHPGAEKFGGLACGICKAAIVVSMVLIILALMPLSYLQRSIRDRSLMGMHFLRIAPNIHNAIAGGLPAIHGEGAPAGGEGLAQQIVSDKSIAWK